MSVAGAAGLSRRLGAAAAGLGLLAAGCASGGPADRGSRPAAVDLERRVGGPVVVAAAGDIADCAGAGCASARTARRVARIDADLVLTLGDNQYPRGGYRDFMAEYDRTWGRFRSLTSPVPGNHEYLRPAARGYFRYFGARAGGRDRGYYSQDVGSWHLVALNSGNGSCRPVRCGRDSAQVRWLRRDLRRADARCLLGYWHHPPWSGGQHGNNGRVRVLWRVLARHGADLVLNGHDHDYERFARRNASGAAAPDGVRQFVVGTGGAELRPFGAPPGALVERRIAGRHGVLRLALGDDSYRWRYLPGRGAALDAGGPVGCGPAARH